MWLAEQQKRENTRETGALGQVTLAGDTPAVELDSECRGLRVYAPGGYRWRPMMGQKVLVLKADGDPCVVGVPASGGLQPGEVGLDSDGGASVRLNNQGRVVLGRDVEILGSLRVGGTELTAMIRAIATQVAAQMLAQMQGS